MGKGISKKKQLVNQNIITIIQGIAIAMIIVDVRN